MKILILFATTLALGGCVSSNRPASVAGECGVFRDPGFAVRGQRLKDKQWVGATQEKGITVCGWKRPKS